MNTAFRAALGQVAAVPGVRAALLATEREGLTVEAIATYGIDTDALAAFATALFRRTRDANRAAGFGATSQVALDAAGGRMLVAECGEMTLVVLAERDTPTGMVRMAMQHATRAVS